MTVDYSVKTSPPASEGTPDLKTSYILFVHRVNPTLLYVDKLLPATDANIAEVRKLVSR